MIKKMPNRKQVSSLQQLCLINVSENIDIWSEKNNNSYRIDDDDDVQTSNFEDCPFACLTNHLLDDIFTYLKVSGKLKRQHLKLLINRNTERIDLCNAPNHTVWFCMEIIEQTCKNLKYLDLSFCDELISSTLESLVESVPQIQSLNLRSTNTTDDVLSIIAENCPKIRSLDIRDCRNVTNNGIVSFCAKKNSHLVQRLLINGTSITHNGALTALRCLSQLQVFDYDNSFGLFDMSCRRMSGPKLKPLYNLKTLSQSDFTGDPITTSTVKLVATLCPNVIKLTLTYADLVDFEVIHRGLSGFTFLEELELDGSHSTPIEFENEIEHLLKVIGKNLTSLRLAHVHSVDLWSIGINCPKLTRLDLVDNPSMRQLPEEKKFARQPFINLRELKIHEYLIPTDVFELLLQNCINLTSLTIVSCYSLTDDLLANVFESNSFLALRYLTLQYCRNVGVSSITSLLSSSDSLIKVNIFECQKIREVGNTDDPLQRYVDLKCLATIIDWKFVSL